MTSQPSIGNITLYDQQVKCSCGKYVHCMGADLESVEKLFSEIRKRIDGLKDSGILRRREHNDAIDEVLGLFK